MIDRQQASDALSDINEIVGRVRQSRIYNLASLIMIMWGVLVFAGNVMTYLWPRSGGMIWIAIDTAGVLGSVAVSALNYPRTGVRTFDSRMLLAFLLYGAFGFFFSVTLGHFTPRQLTTFWPLYVMMAYTIAGLSQPARLENRSRTSGTRASAQRRSAPAPALSAPSATTLSTGGAVSTRTRCPCTVAPTSICSCR